MMKRTFTITILAIVLATACKDQQTPREADKTDSPKTASVTPSDTIALVRKIVREEPVDSYKEKTENPLNDWYFQVRLYETKNTFHYLMKLEYEEIRGTDTLKIPNIGVPPQPVIKKGSEKYSCIIGFLDKNKEFREYKKVFVKNNALKVITLKRYRVTTHTVVESAAE